MKIQLASHHSADKPSRIRMRNEKKIIAAAEVEFAKHGFKGSSIQEIASNAGLPKANIHYYFGSKLKLYGAVLINILEMWDELLVAMDPNSDPYQELESYIRAKMALVVDYPLASRVFAQEVMSGAPQLQEYFKEDYQEWFQERVAVFNHWISQGKMDDLPAEYVIFLLWSSTQHYADFTYQVSSALGKSETGLDSKDFEQATNTLLHIILKGCGITAQTQE